MKKPNKALEPWSQLSFDVIGIEMSVPTRQPTPDEFSYITETLVRLRNHYHQWPEYGEDYLDLVKFAFYENCGNSDCCGRLLAEATPIALGNELVNKHGFSWVMTHRENDWHFSVAHPAFESPIDVTTLENREWNDEDYDGIELSPGEVTADSLDCIIRRMHSALKKSR
jgi:hypothetical protein